MSSATTARLRSWSHERVLLGRRPTGSAAGPLEALREVVAVYSAHPAGPLSLLARAAPFTPERFGEMERAREAVRVPGMRGSIFLAPRASAGRIFAATKGLSGPIETRLRALGLELATYEALRPRILEATREPTTPQELKRVLDADGSAVYAMRTMAREGLILRVGWGDRVRSDSLRWVATESWLGEPLDAPAPDEALRWLLESYFRAFGPARVEDAAWWTGLSHTAARNAVAELELEEVESGLLLPPDLAEAFRAVQPIDDDVLAVLPKWDPYTMGYAPDGRGRLVDDRHLPLAYSTARTKVGATAGDGQPLVLQGGRAIAAWQHRLAGPRMQVTIRPFDRGTLPDPERLKNAFEPIGTLFGARLEIAEETG